MQSPIIHQQLILSTERVRDLHRSMQAHSAAIPAAEMDAFLAEIRKTYELALQLHYQNAVQLLNEMQHTYVPPVSQPAPAKVNPAPVAETPAPKPVPTETKKVEEKPVQPVAKTPIAEEKVSPRKEEHNEISVRKEEISEIPVQIPSPANMSMDKLMADISKAENNEKTPSKKGNTDLNERFEPSATIAHKFEELETLADRIASSQTASSLSEQLHRVPVKDLKVAIGLNEKFQFINQLFNGDSQKYNTAIDFLNTCGSASKAQDYMKTAATEFNWEKHPAPAEIFMDIVERRYLA